MRLSRGKITAALLAGLLLVATACASTWLTVAHYMRLAPCAERAPAHGSPAANLPLVLVSATPAHETQDLMAILYTGDGGWTPINQRLTAELARRGVPTVGVLSPRYFWTRRTPGEAAHDLERLIDFYTARWSRPRVILIGYSRGAGVLPAMVNRLGEEQLKKIDELALLGLEPRISFAVGLRDYAFGCFDTDEFDVLPELKKLKVPRVTAFYGAGETKSLTRQLDLPTIQKIALPGGHHFGGAYERIAQLILLQLSSTRSRCLIQSNFKSQIQSAWPNSSSAGRALPSESKSDIRFHSSPSRRFRTGMHSAPHQMTPRPSPSGVCRTASIRARA